MRRKVTVFLTFDEAARRAGVTTSGIRQACESGHMTLYLFGASGSALLRRAVDEAEFEEWRENRQPPGRPPKKRKDGS